MQISRLPRRKRITCGGGDAEAERNLVLAFHLRRPSNLHETLYVLSRLPSWTQVSSSVMRALSMEFEPFDGPAGAEIVARVSEILSGMQKKTIKEG